MQFLPKIPFQMIIFTHCLFNKYFIDLHTIYLINIFIYILIKHLFGCNKYSYINNNYKLKKNLIVITFN